MTDAPRDPAPPVLDTQVVAPAAGAPLDFASLVAAGPPRLQVGPVLSRTLWVWWAHVGAFTAMSIVVYAPMLAGFGWFFAWAMGAARGAPPVASEVFGRSAALFAALGVTMVLSVVQMGAVTYGTVRRLQGERAPFGRMIAVGFRRGLPVVGTGFVVAIVTVLGFMAFLVPGVVFLVASCVSTPAAVVERPGMFGAIRRSFDLTRGNRWPLLAAGLVIVVVLWILSAVVQVAATLLTSLFLPPGEAVAFTVVTSQLGSALFSVIPVVAISVCYHDLRLLKEGVDTAQLAKVFE